MSCYLVTGGAGFIGSHLCDALLAQGHEVRVLDDLSTGKRCNLDPRATFVRGDVTDPACVGEATARVDGVFHLAAIASVARGNEDWPGTHRVNQTATILVLDAARSARLDRPVPVVYASSAAIYGDTGGAVAREDRHPAPLTAYGADKLGCELHARVAAHVHGVPTIGLRFFNVYGARQDPDSPYSGVISIFAKRLAQGQPITFHGDGQQTRDFVHVSDVVAHLRAAMRHAEESAPGSAALNVCTGRATSIRSLAQLLASSRGITPELIAGPARAGDIRNSQGCPERAAAMLGLRAALRLEDGLRDVT